MTEGLPNVRRITSKLLLRYKANLEASGTSWNNVDWEEYELESGPGGNTGNTSIKIVNSCPVWKEVFEEQKETRPNYCNVKIYGSDGYALAHLIFLQHVSGLVRSHVEAQVAEGDPPPSPKNILGVTLDDVKVEDIRTILNLLYCGSKIVNHANGSEVIRIMQLLKIFNLTLQHEPLIGKGIELDGFQQQVRVYHYKRRELGNAESSAVQVHHQQQLPARSSSTTPLYLLPPPPPPVIQGTPSRLSLPSIIKVAGAPAAVAAKKKRRVSFSTETEGKEKKKRGRPPKRPTENNCGDNPTKQNENGLFISEGETVRKKKKKKELLIMDAKQTPLQHLVKIESIELPVCYFLQSQLPNRG